MWFDPYSVSDITDHQRSCVSKCISSRLGILGGSPGCGKSYVAARVISKMIDIIGRNHICVAAPTGRAAVRMTEAMSEYGIPLSARTIHSTLGVESSGNGWSFVHGQENPLPYKFFVIDESSMLGTGLANSLFSAFPKDSKVLLVGDVHQLPPVEHGAPLRDMISSGVPYGELTEIHRNAGGIVQACAAIRRGESFEYQGNLHLIERHDPEQQKNAIVQVIDAVSRKLSLDPIWDFQVICAVNEKSEVSRKELNLTLQNHLNPSPIIKDSPFRLNDKVVNTKNGWLPASDDFWNLPASETQDVMANDDGKIYVANGDFGRVIRIEKKFMEVILSAPKRLVIVPRGRQDDPKGNEDSSTGCNWQLGYSASCHKFQGAETPIAIVVLDDSNSAGRVCSREWLMTAYSRAKQHCYAVGKRSTGERFIKRTAIDKRKTFLQSWIKEGLSEF
jgi:exodeoxyribonuclease V alpha subunit